MIFDVFEYSNKGGRSYNEDAVGHKIEGGSGIFVVADGLGGHSLGEVASACVRDTLVAGWSAGRADRTEWLTEQITKANENVLKLKEERGKVLKSTVVALTIDEDEAVWAHSGDSRLYCIHNDEIAAVTDDHSVAFKKYKAGEIAREEIATDEDQSSLLRVIGNEERFEPQVCVFEEPVERGDAFLLCSDGAWELFKDEEVLIDYLKSENARKWAERLLVRMIDRIGEDHDNLTVLTVMLK
ncbi:MAG: serine/threonine-protein phosphatase [Clostridiales bacterium]|nr:serine/threonine-protein phosphatase [Clostridiales bacterium]